jgi:hypothetical protein
MCCERLERPGHPPLLTCTNGSKSTKGLAGSPPVARRRSETTLSSPRLGSGRLPWPNCSVRTSHPFPLRGRRTLQSRIPRLLLRSSQSSAAASRRTLFFSFLPMLHSGRGFDRLDDYPWCVTAVTERTLSLACRCLFCLACHPIQ